METIATERLNKIGKNPNLMPRHDVDHLRAVNELLLLSAQSPDTQSENDDLTPTNNLNETTSNKRGALPRPKSDNCFRFNLVNDLANLINEAAHATTQFSNQSTLQPPNFESNNASNKSLLSNNQQKKTTNENNENQNILNEIVDQQRRSDRLSNSAYERRRTKVNQNSKIIEETADQTTEKSNK